MSLSDFNTYVMGLWSVLIFLLLECGIDFRRQILTSKVDLRAGMVGLPRGIYAINDSLRIKLVP